MLRNTHILYMRHTQKCQTGKHTQTHTLYTQRHASRCNATPQVHTLRNSLIHRRHAPKLHCNIQTYTFRDTPMHTKTQMYTATQIPTLRNTHIYTEIQSSVQHCTQVHTLRNTCVHIEMHKQFTLQYPQVSTERYIPTETHIYTQCNQMYPLTLTDTRAQKLTHRHRGYVMTGTHTYTQRDKQVCNVIHTYALGYTQRHIENHVERYACKHRPQVHTHIAHTCTLTYMQALTNANTDTCKQHTQLPEHAPRQTCPASQTQALLHRASPHMCAPVQPCTYRSQAHNQLTYTQLLTTHKCIPIPTLTLTHTGTHSLAGMHAHTYS